MEKKREQLNPADLWDLSTLYASDEVWKEDSGKLEKDIQSVEDFRGRLVSAEAIRAYYDADTALSRRLNNIATYAMLRLSENTKDTKAQELMSAANRFIVQAMARTAFARPEILTLPEEKLREITDSEVLAPYRFLMQELVEEKPHVLSDREEALLGSFGEVLGSPKTIADTLMDADLTFEDAADSTGGKHPVTGANFILLEQSGDRKLRENAFRSFYRGYRSHINTFAAAYSGIVKAHTAEAQVRHYGSSREMALEQEHIPLGVYDSLISTVRQSLPLMAACARSCSSSRSCIILTSTRPSCRDWRRTGATRRHRKWCWMPWRRSAGNIRRTCGTPSATAGSMSIRMRERGAERFPPEPMIRIPSS